MSAASEVSAANDEEATTAVEQEPAATAAFLQVHKGNPTDAELAALIAVLGTAGGGGAEAAAADRNLWGHPVDKLRFPLFSWQRLTLLQRTHIRR